MYCIKKTPNLGAKAILRTLFISILFTFSIQSSQIYGQSVDVNCGVTNYMTPTPCNGQFIVNGDFSDILDIIQSGGEISDANWWNSSNYNGP